MSKSKAASSYAHRCLLKTADWGFGCCFDEYAASAILSCFVGEEPHVVFSLPLDQLPEITRQHLRVGNAELLARWIMENYPVARGCHERLVAERKL